MSNKQFGVVVFSISFGITCLIWGALMGIIAKDLSEQLIEQKIYMCGVEK